MTRIDGSLAGVVVAQTQLALVDGEKGIALVRGYPLPDLAARCTYEEVAHLVLLGELPGPSSGSFLRGLGSLDPASSEAARTIGKILPRPEALASSMGLLDATTGGLGAQEQAAAALACVPALVAAVAGLAAPEVGWSYARRALAALGAHRTDPLATRALEVLLSLEAEHGLSASTFACRVAASSGARAGVSLGAAVATLTGHRHGGATAEARSLLLEAWSDGDAASFVERAQAQKRRLAGFGHRIYKVADPRIPPLRAAIEAMGGARLLPIALRLSEEVERRYGARGIHANIDLFGAVLLDALGVDPDQYVAAFALGLAPGWLAHWIEQGATGRLIRPDSLYEGPPPRAVPR
ncbi:MAG: citrate/2-methylcitrate synthase [Polyangiaceae bacterium]|jgi:citrate synthase|nr:citrate/2-methylcitrate synthase [Polyangiaceae bacterium]